ncbi:MAG: hypothetical protein RIQ93_1494 [Verrucomicrobiota bacterium]|jgi:uncharacterized lipoprotein YmbA
MNFMKMGLIFCLRRLPLALGMGGALAGCSIPIPQAAADPTRYYVLSASQATAPGVAGGPAVYLRNVELASYLRARPLIVRRGENEIEFREFARWGEPLELGVGRVLREELLARGAAGSVLVAGLRSSNVSYDYELTVRVLACEGAADGGVNFRAVWDLVKGGTKTPAAAGDFRATDLRWDGKSEASLAAGLSAAVAGLARQVAAELKK